MRIFFSTLLCALILFILHAPKIAKQVKDDLPQQHNMKHASIAEMRPRKNGRWAFIYLFVACVLYDYMLVHFLLDFCMQICEFLSACFTDNFLIVHLVAIVMEEFLVFLD